MTDGYSDRQETTGRQAGSQAKRQTGIKTHQRFHPIEPACVRAGALTGSMRERVFEGTRARARTQAHAHSTPHTSFAHTPHAARDVADFVEVLGFGQYRGRVRSCVVCVLCFRWLINRMQIYKGKND